MEASHNLPCNYTHTQQEEHQISSLFQEVKMSSQNGPQLVHLQNARSKVSPRWTLSEILVLVREKWVVENDILQYASKVQNGSTVSDKWKVVSSNCKDSKVERTALQCRKKWESLMFDYKKIKSWEFRSETQSYWNMSCNTRKQHKLPSYMERELFETIDAQLSKLPSRFYQARFDSLDTVKRGTFTIEDDMPEMQDQSPSGNIPESRNASRQKRQRKSSANEDDIEHVIATAIHKNSQKMQSLLHEATQAHICSSQLERDMYWRAMEMNKELQLQISDRDRELTRKQSEDLIEVLGDLVNAINHLVDSIQRERSHEWKT